MGRRLAVLGGLGVAIFALLPAAAAGAHPLGNFTTNQYVGVRVAPDRVVLDYVVDKAEIPTFQDASEFDTDGSGAADATEAAAWARAQCASFRDHLSVVADGRPLALSVTGQSATFPEGQAGLDTERIECRYEAPGTGATVEVADGNFPDRIGWREITAVGDGTTVAGDAPTTSLSDRLRAYPQDRIASPPDERSVSLSVTPGGPRAAELPALPSPGSRYELPKGVTPRGIDRLSRHFTGFIDDRDLTVGFALLGFAASIALGAAHALAPGHGKTVMAAYLVGQRGTRRQAAIVGTAVTVTHTAGVLVLGIAISSSTLVAPDRVYPWLGLASGLMLASIGATILRRVVRARRSGTLPIDVALGNHRTFATAGDVASAVAVPAADVRVPVGVGARGALDLRAAATAIELPLLLDAPASALPGRPADHAHSVGSGSHPHGGHSHSHDGHVHGDGSHSHGFGMHSHRHVPIDPEQPFTLPTLIGMGFAGGMVPSPSALIVLLGSIAVGRAWFGVTLVVAYGIGMACTLTLAGLALLKARRTIERRVAEDREPRRLLAIGRVLPLLSAVTITTVGLYLAVRAVGQL
jgi:ABC-type nickel/cobalt efflux system permease component RcnA